jgi:transposase, IS30 family
MKYRQLTSGERYELSALRKQGLTPATIARALGRHRSTIAREIQRNSRKDGGYRPSTAGEMARGRRSRSRRNLQFTPEHWALVLTCLKQRWSPQQIAGRLALQGPSLHQPRDHLSVYLERSLARRLLAHLPAALDQADAQALRAL